MADVPADRPSGLTRELMAMRVAQEFEDGSVVNLGIGLPTMCSSALPAGRTGFEIEVVTNDGRTLVERHSGRPSRNPALKGSTYEQLVGKFRQQVAFSGFVPAVTADEIVRRIDRLEDERDMAAFVRLLTRTQLRVA